ncbi:MAG: hypothetical protein AAF282_07340 [Cyanobacteria bacterium P01_A01_bin.15]
MLVPKRENPQGYQPTIRNVIAGTFFLGSVFGAGIGYGFQKTMSANQPTCATIASQYALIQLDMTPTEVRSILGPGNEIRKSKLETVIAWTVSEGQVITATFQNNQLVFKELLGTECLHKVEKL